MAVNASLQIVLSPKTHDLSYDPEKAARRYRRGDIFDVHRSASVANFDQPSGEWHVDGGSTHFFGYIHITDVPDNRFRNMKQVLSSESPEVDGQGNIDNYRRRHWRIPLANLPAPQRNALLNDREITVGWVGFRDKIRRKSISNRLDPQTDDESNAVTDGELP